MTKDSGKSLAAVLSLIFTAAVAVAGWASFYFAQQEADQLGKENSQLAMKLATQGDSEQKAMDSKPSEKSEVTEKTQPAAKPEAKVASAPAVAPKKAATQSSSKEATQSPATNSSGAQIKTATPAPPATITKITTTTKAPEKGAQSTTASTQASVAEKTQPQTKKPAAPKRYNRLLLAEREKAIKERNEAQARISAMVKQKRDAAKESTLLKEKLALANADVLILQEKVKEATAQMDEVRKNQEGRFEELRNKLEQELQQKQVTISQLKDRMTVVNVNAEILFNSGSVTIKPKGQQVLDLIADTLNRYPDRMISIEGHTDNIPVVSNTRFPSNWELSAARAAAAVRYLQENAGVKASRMQAVGHGEHQPENSNDTPEGRAVNRRIEIILLPII